MTITAEQSNVQTENNTQQSSVFPCANANPIAVANTFVDLVKRDNRWMRTGKLQRLVYLTAEAFLQKHKKQLFAEPFLAWNFGPGLSSIHYTYTGSIQSVRNSDGECLHYVWSLKNNDIYDCIATIWRHYGGYTFEELCDITRKPDGAWDEAWQNNIPFFQPKLIES